MIWSSCFKMCICYLDTDVHIHTGQFLAPRPGALGGESSTSLNYVCEYWNAQSRFNYPAELLSENPNPSSSRHRLSLIIIYRKSIHSHNCKINEYQTTSTLFVLHRSNLLYHLKNPAFVISITPNEDFLFSEKRFLDNVKMKPESWWCKQSTLQSLRVLVQAKDPSKQSP